MFSVVANRTFPNSSRQRLDVLASPHDFRIATHSNSYPSELFIFIRYSFYTFDRPAPKKSLTAHFSVMASATTPAVFGPVPNRAYHEGFMRKAIEMAELALASDETPVGCVFVHEGEVIGRGINGTNASLNVLQPLLATPATLLLTRSFQGTRHAEFVALAEIMAKHPQSILRSTDLYVTVEPCIMCASALRQYGIRAVYFGSLNDRFGGCGGVMNIHSDKAVEPGYPVYGGLFREEAIMLLRKFYVQENNKGQLSCSLW